MKYLILLLFLSHFTALTAAAQDHITIHAIMAKRPFTYRNLNRTFLQMVRKSRKGNDFTWGHVLVEIQCTDSQGERNDFVLSYTTGRNSNTYADLIHEGHGLGIINSTVGGKLLLRESIEEFNPNVYKEQDRWYSVKFLISATMCDQAKTYHEEFRERDNARRYSIASCSQDPGYSCSSFAGDMVANLGIFCEEEQDGWVKDILIPVSLIGSEDNFVDSRDLYKKAFFRRLDWIFPGGLSEAMRIYDPNIIAEWIENELHKQKKWTETELVIDRRDR